MYNITEAEIDNGPEEKKCEKPLGTNQPEEMVMCAGEVRYLLAFKVIHL